MPIYEYICHDCHKPFELMQKMNDQPCSSCPNCNGSQVEKQVSAAGFQLKGTGWYVTDFKEKKNKASPTDANSSTNNASSSTDGKSS